MHTTYRTTLYKQSKNTAPAGNDANKTDFETNYQSLALSVSKPLHFNADTCIIDDSYTDFKAKITSWSDVRYYDSGQNGYYEIYLSDNFTDLMDYDGGNNLIYQGKAPIGSATSAAKWQIKQYNYTGANLTSIKWADGNEKMDNIWDNRISLNYS